jgi:hypothetical protein
MCSSLNTERSKPGVWRSDVEGHLLVLKLEPVSVTCVVCMETCAPDQSKSPKQAAEQFTSKHGYLGEWIANNIAELIPPR